MAFYTPTWVRKLVKEDHANIQKYLENQKNDFRSYIDGVTPFVLWLDISLIRERILEKSSQYIKELAKAVSQDRDVSDIVMKLLDKAYVNTINAYANNPRYVKIDQTKLEELLTTLSTAQIGSVKNTIAQNFTRTMVVTNVTKKDHSVMLILPKFTTLEFGPVFRKELEKLVRASKLLKSEPPAPIINNMFAGLGSKTPSADSSEKSRMLAFVEANFSKLQNIGHVEVDVVSEAEKKVMRGQNSPRLLQALVTIPNEIKSFERLQLKFSKETGQALTRLKVRKKFTGSKLVFELLVEHGLAVGIPETQADNLYKAQLERAFTIGSGLTATLRKDISILANLETSKSFNQYITEAFVNTLKGSAVKSYSSQTSITEKTPVTKTKVTLQNVKKQAKSSSPLSLLGADVKKALLTNLTGLKTIINSKLSEQIKLNMGNGSRRDVLNLRSGRLAESAEVARLSESRAGMITAFYTYMKNPYATFSEGGRQQYPRSRDPKLLISKSIREIAAQEVANRLRAVVI